MKSLTDAFKLGQEIRDLLIEIRNLLQQRKVTTTVTHLRGVPIPPEPDERNAHGGQ